jgi:hypothetical protein
MLDYPSLVSVGLLSFSMRVHHNICLNASTYWSSPPALQVRNSIVRPGMSTTTAFEGQYYNSPKLNFDSHNIIARENWLPALVAAAAQ